VVFVTLCGGSNDVLWRLEAMFIVVVVVSTSVLLLTVGVWIWVMEVFFSPATVFSGGFCSGISFGGGSLLQ
jgi:hypothetical protein